MSREVKFRAWHKRVKKLYPVIGINWDNATKFRLVGDFSTGSSIGHEYEYDSEIILMQYTGLTDKNGNEIYEGDILKYHNGRLSKPIEFPKDYTWLATRIAMFAKGNKPSAVEVIGNIYENPDLLREETTN
jgi:uncharacterized phage protein (TIGR01671 family)